MEGLSESASSGAVERTGDSVHGQAGTNDLGLRIVAATPHMHIATGVAKTRGNPLRVVGYAAVIGRIFAGNQVEARSSVERRHRSGEWIVRDERRK